MTASSRRRQPPVVAAWSELRPGTPLTIVKLAPSGAEAARYPGEVVAGLSGDSWIVVRANWTNRTLELDGLSFCPGDDLLEWFSPRHPFNAFAVLTAEGRLKGWYANVTQPARLDDTPRPPVLMWADLFVDLVGLPDGSFTIRDDDELLAAGLDDLDPDLHQNILGARAELIRRFERRLLPFSEPAEIASLLLPAGQERPAR